jgi:hypothetical protein
MKIKEKETSRQHLRSVNMREAGRRHLRLHHSSHKKTPASHQVLLEELGDDHGDVRHVHL